MVLKVAFAALFVVSSACTVGEVGGGGNTPTPDAPTPPADSGGGGGSDAPSGPDPAVTFESQVKPAVATCRIANCHLDAVSPNFNTYATLVSSGANGKYIKQPGSTNPLVIKGAHSGPALAAGDKTDIVEWIDSLTP